MTKTFRVCSLSVAVLLLAGVPALRADKEGEPITAPAALQKLKAGNARFVEDKPAPRDVGPKKRAQLVQGQRPFAIVLTCADSRVTPELIFDQGLGDLFVLRVAGNVSDPDIVGSMEYAVEHLHCPLVVVLGHESCGAVQAAVEGEEVHGNLAALIGQVHPGTKLPEDKKAALAAGVKNNVLFQAGELTHKSPVLKELAGSGRIRIVAGVYSLKTGEVDWLELPKPKGRETEKSGGR
jgi:carbonic anhydrase